ncbi:MAG: ATP-binding protein [Cyanobacteria bacterium P01_D01_bin.56]
MAFLSPYQLTESLYLALSGSFTHTILEWSAFCTALFTAILAFAHFATTRDVTTPVLGVVLLCAGMMDAFHTLAADRLIEAVADNRNLIPFTWALCRLFNVLLTIVGVSLFLMGNVGNRWRGNIVFVGVISSFFGFIAYGTIKICATSDNLPNTLFPNSLITRPWDVLPLILFLFAGIFIYPRFFQKYPSLFSHALVISTIPNVATQLHMSFGSEALFDNHFNIAHFLKIIAYLVPLLGLILDYVYTHRELRQRNWDVALENAERRKTQAALESTLFDLKNTQTQLVQTEKMSGLGQLVAGVAHEINNPVNFIHGNLTPIKDYSNDLFQLLKLYQTRLPEPDAQLQEVIDSMDLPFIEKDLPKVIDSMKTGTQRIREIVLSLRNFSRLDEAEYKSIDVHEGINNTLVILNHRLKEQPYRPAIQVNKHYGDLPMVECYSGKLNQVFMNLLSNAIDALDSRDSEDFNLQNNNTSKENSAGKEPSQVTITTTVQDPEHICIAIADNGRGIPASIQQRIFDPFFTTKAVGKGTGMGLSISYQIITESHHGSLSLVTDPGNGTTFLIVIPIRQREVAQ